MRIKNSFGDYAFNTFNTIFLSLFTLACFYPFYYIFLYSISDSVEAARGAVVLWPVKPDFSTYQLLLNKSEVLNAAFISAARTVIGTLITIFCCSYLAFVFSREEMPFRKTIYRYVIFTMFLAPGLIPWYMTMIFLGLKNNFLLYVLPGAISGFFIILIKTYMESLPKALEDSARIDGAGNFILYFKVILPLSIPIIATVAIFCAVGQWNSWQDNFYLVNNKDLTTLQLLLLNYLKSSIASGDAGNMSLMKRAGNAMTTSPMQLKMTMSVITVLPIILVYPALQKYFIKGIMLGAVKG